MWVIIQIKLFLIISCSYVHSLPLSSCKLQLCIRYINLISSGCQQGPIIFQSYVSPGLDERRPTETETAEIDLDSCDILPRAHDRCKLPCLGQPWQLSPRPPDEVPPLRFKFHRRQLFSTPSKDELGIQISDYFERFYHTWYIAIMMGRAVIFPIINIILLGPSHPRNE
jgi:hypothetical protein